MAVWIALLRGINVGGKNKMPMKSLVTVLNGIGLTDVQTYIQSGNVVFRSPSRSAPNLPAQISDAINNSFGFRVPVVVIQKSALLRAEKANPFPKAANEADGKALHVFFLDEKPKNIDTNALNSAKSADASWALNGQVLYLHTPSGFHKSKLAAKVERLLGVTATARNWRTVSKLVELANTKK